MIAWLGRVFPVLIDAARWLVVASAVSLVGWFTLYTNTPDIRYSEYYNQCQMIFGPDMRQGNQVDLAVIGTSRSMRALQASLLADKVENRFGQRPVIFDLSRSYRDIGHMLPFVKDLLEHAPVDMLLVEYKETGKQWRHPYYERTATFAQIAESFLSRPSVPTLERLQEQVHLFLDRLTYRFTQFLKGKPRRRCVPETKSKPRTTDPSAPWFVSSELLVKLRSRNHSDWAKAHPMSVDLEALDEERNNFYVRRMTDMARAHNVQIYFYYIPPLYGRAMAPDFVKHFRDTFDASLLQLAEEDLRAIYPEGYTDGSHMGWRASDIYMSRLLEFLPWSQALDSHPVSKQ